MKSFYIVISILYSILGLIHSACTPVFYELNSINALWFSGTGLSLVFLGFLNIAALKSNNKLVYNLCVLGNVISLFFNVYITVIIIEPQAFIGIALNLILLIESIYFRIKTD